MPEGRIYTGSTWGNAGPGRPSAHDTRDYNVSLGAHLKKKTPNGKRERGNGVGNNGLQRAKITFGKQTAQPGGKGATF